MAHILMGWELGAGRGHAVELAELARTLQRAGHRVSFAVRRLDVMRAQNVPDAAIWQAPVTPRMLAGGAGIAGPLTGMADILARLGMDDAPIVAGMVEAWRHLLGAIAPDIVIGDYAPFLLLAARGRVPTISRGTGFSTPPSTMDELPALVKGSGGVDQAALLGAVNAGLAEIGEAPIEALPRVFAADRELVVTLAELDPYAAHRTTPLTLPEPMRDPPAARQGDEVFVYMHEQVAPDALLWPALAASKLKVRVYAAWATAAVHAAIVNHGLIAEPAPVPFARIAERSRLLVSHGGHGFICAGLAAGLPHVVCHSDLEKLGHGVAIAAAGVGGHIPLAAIKPEPFARSLVEIHEGAGFAERARDLAADIRGREGAFFHDAALRAIAELS